MIAAVLILALALSGGSDSPTPYTVDVSGITLPSGATFPDNGHVNVRTESGTFSLHFEGKCITRSDAECAGARHAAAQFIGASFIPWSAFGITSGCVEWVQIADFAEHHGEGGQPPVCLVPPVDPPIVVPPVEPPIVPPVDPLPPVIGVPEFPTPMPTSTPVVLASTGTPILNLALVGLLMAGIGGASLCLKKEKKR